MDRSVFRIHPAIAVARVGNSDQFNLAPETMAGFPLHGEPYLVGGLPIRPDTESEFITEEDLRDDNLALKRHAARFRIYHYVTSDNESYPHGKGTEIQIGAEVDERKVVDIVWTVHVANKKANTFVLVEDGDAQGISGYEPPRLPPIRNWPTVDPDQEAPQPPDEKKLNVLNDPTRVKRLTIDPGPRTVSGRNAPPVQFDRETLASFYDFDRKAVVQIADYPKSFPQDSFEDLDSPSGLIETLGQLRTDSVGRLLFTGGYGRAAGIRIKGSPVRLDDDVNNDQWFDDTSDGPVSAVVIFDDGSIALAHGAWVTTTDPSFAPQILNVVSLWDDIYDAWVRYLGLAPQTFEEQFNLNYKPTFDDQIAPIFRAAALQQWTTNMNAHGRSAHSVLTAITAQTDPATTPLAGLTIFRNPNDEAQYEPTSLMPLHLGDANRSFLSLTKTQYFFLRQWNKGIGHFDVGAGPRLGPGEMLDKAALVNCLGGRFSPGIDLTFIMREPDVYIKDWQHSGCGPFRIRRTALHYDAVDHNRPFLTCGYVPRHTTDGLEPGDLSKFMAIPWHTDYNSCATHPPSPNPRGNRTLFWSWPAQRPVAVFVARDVAVGVDRITGNPIAELGDQRWSVRGPGTKSDEAQNWGRYQPPIRQMLDNWHRIGTVMQSPAIHAEAGQPPRDPLWFLEVASTLLDDDSNKVELFPNYDQSTIDSRELFLRLMSDHEPDDETLRQARVYVDQFLRSAKQFAADPKRAPEDQLFFPYTEEAFQERLDMVYQEYVDDANASDPADPAATSGYPIKTRQDMITRIIQLAPFNLIDGAWLRGIGKTGPIDEVRALLYSIFMDELGDGDVSMNHCNIYLDLCHSVGYYPPPLNTPAFVYDPQFVEDAFAIPAFELAISELS